MEASAGRPPPRLGWRERREPYRIDVFDRSRLALDTAVVGAFGAIPLAATLQGALAQGLPGLCAVGLWLGAMWTQRDRIRLDRDHLHLGRGVSIATTDISSFEARTARLQGVACYDVMATMRHAPPRLVTTLHRHEHATYVADRLQQALETLRRGSAYRSPSHWHR